MKQELSTTTIDQLLPDNFESLSERRKKQIIAHKVIAVYRQAMEYLEFEDKAKQAAEKLNLKVKQNPDVIKLAALKKEIKRHRDGARQLLDRYDGMRMIALEFGISEKNLLPQNIGE